MRGEQQIGRGRIQRDNALWRTREPRNIPSEVIALDGSGRRVRAARVASVARESRGGNAQSEQAQSSMHARAPDPEVAVPVNDGADWPRSRHQPFAPEGLLMWRGREASPGFGLRGSPSRPVVSGVVSTR